jgi:AcrR family transcriptional regulator
MVVNFFGVRLGSCAEPLQPIRARWHRMADVLDAKDATALASTPQRMLDVAEHLFAQKGIDMVSIREIVLASGQANPSAARYHFGSREALIGALMERRIRAINMLRVERLDALEESGAEADVHAVVSLTIGALGDIVRTQPWGGNYVRVAAQALFSPDLHLRNLIDPEAWAGHNRLNAKLRALLSDLPEPVFRERIRIFSYEAIYSVARWVQSHGTVTARNRHKFDEMIRTTRDFLAAGIAAPMGPP